VTNSDVARVAVGRLQQIVETLNAYDPRLGIVARVMRRFEPEAADFVISDEFEAAENLLLNRTCDTCAFLRRTSRVENRRLVLVAEMCVGMAGRALPAHRTCGGWRSGKPA
jgi:hypothetical protein